MKFVSRKQRNHYFANNKHGLNGILITANDQKDAIKKSREIHGRGAKAEFYKKDWVTKYKNE